MDIKVLGWLRPFDIPREKSWLMMMECRSARALLKRQIGTPRAGRVTKLVTERQHALANHGARCRNSASVPVTCARRRRAFDLLSVALGIAIASSALGQALPEGNSGIASRYPVDLGIGSDPQVIFADDFESYSNASNLTSKWSDAFHAVNRRIATEGKRLPRRRVEFAHGGAKPITR